MDTKYHFTHLSSATLMLCSFVLEAFILLFLWDLKREFNFPELSYLVLPYQILAVILFSLAQLALFCGWKLAFAAQEQVFYEKTSEKWIQIALYALFCILLTTCGITLHLLYFEQISNLTVTVFLISSIVLELATIGVARFAKHLYVNARAEHEELQEVI